MYVCMYVCMYVYRISLLKKLMLSFEILIYQ